MSPQARKARRATIYRDHEGKFRAKIQGGNWRTIEASEQGFKQKSTVVKRIEKRWPGVEIVDLTNQRARG